MIASTSVEATYGASRRAPSSGWRLIVAHSSSSRGPGFARIEWGTMSFPTSCSFAASSRLLSSGGLSPNAAPTRTLIVATRSAWGRNRRSPALAREKSASTALVRVLGMIEVGFTMAGRPALPLSGDVSVSPSSETGQILETVPDTLPLWVAESAEGPGRAEARSSKRRSGPSWRPAELGTRARIIVAAVLLALVLPAVATWAFGHAYRSSETNRIDVRLSAALRVAADRVSAVDRSAARSARTLAESSAVQRALVGHDQAALERFTSRRGIVSLSV